MWGWMFESLGLMPALLFIRIARSKGFTPTEFSTSLMAH